MSKKNLSMILFGMLVLVTHIELSCCEPVSLAVVTAVTGMIVTRAVKNTATYKTYEQHCARLAKEKDQSDFSLRHAEKLRLSGANEASFEEKSNPKLGAFLKQYEQDQKNFQEAQKKQLEPTRIWHHALCIIEDYSRNYER